MRDKTVYVNHYYFYIDDEDFGPLFLDPPLRGDVEGEYNDVCEKATPCIFCGQLCGKLQRIRARGRALGLGGDAILLVLSNAFGDGALADGADDHTDQTPDDERNDGPGENRVDGVTGEDSGRDRDREGGEGTTGRDDFCSDARGQSRSLLLNSSRSGRYLGVCRT